MGLLLYFWVARGHGLREVKLFLTDNVSINYEKIIVYNQQ